MAITMRYKECQETLKWIKELIAKGQISQEDAEKHFPMLSMSEDERIKNEIIEFFKAICNPIDGESIEDISIEDIKEWIAWLEKQGEHSIYNIPSREVILSIWDLGNEWKELTGGSISTKHGTQLNYIQKHWSESEYYLRVKQDENSQGKLALEAVKEEEVDNQNCAIDKVEPKFKVGDWIVGDINPTLQQVKDIVNNTSNGCLSYDIGENVLLDVAAQEGFHLWTIQDAKDGDVLVIEKTEASYESVFIFKEIEDARIIQHFHYFNTGKEDIIEPRSNDGFIGFVNDYIHPATKEQRDALMKAMTDAGYTFDFAKKGLKHIVEPVNGEDYGVDGLWHAQRILEKTLGEVDGYQSDDGILEHKAAIGAVKALYEKESSWSEEDEKNLQGIIDEIEANKSSAPDYDLDTYDRFLFWLESLEGRVQPQSWKPSDAQMQALKEACDKHWEPDGLDPLYTLYEQLKKL